MGRGRAPKLRPHAAHAIRCSSAAPGRRLVHGEADGAPASSSTRTPIPRSSCSTARRRPRSGARASTTCSRASSAAARRSRTSGCAANGASAVHGEALRGDPPAEIVINEDEARFGVDVRRGQKTGFFLDQRDNRRTIRRHAAGATRAQPVLVHRRLLDPRRARWRDARHVASTSRRPRSRRSRRTSRSPVCRPSARARRRRLRSTSSRAPQKQGRTWDLVIVDPPSFAPNERSQARGAARVRAARRVPRSRWSSRRPVRARLVLESHHRSRSPRRRRRLTGADLRLRIAAGAASDHPVLAAFTEGRYLKFLFFDVA